MQKLEGTITVRRRPNGYVMDGFSPNDFNRLCVIARKVYKIKTTRKRILKKYVKRLLNEAIRQYIDNRSIF